MAMVVAERALVDRRRGLIGWTAGIAAYVGMMTAFYPAVRNSEIQRAIQNYPDQLKAMFGGMESFDFSSGHGYLNAELFSLMIPAMFVIAAIGYGAAAVAGEREAGTLDLLLAQPLTRRRVALEKIAGLAATVGIIMLATAATIVVIGAMVDLGVSALNVVWACLGSALVALVAGLVTMLTGVVTGRRASAIVAGTVVFVAAYALVALAGLVSWMEPFQALSPMYHANGSMPVKNGLPAGHYAVLLAAGAMLAAVTTRMFERRDITH